MLRTEATLPSPTATITSTAGSYPVAWRRLPTLARRLGSQAQQVRLEIEPGHGRPHLVERPLCQQTAAIEIEHGVCAPYGRQPVRDRDRGHVRSQLLDRVCHQVLGLGV